MNPSKFVETTVNGPFTRRWVLTSADCLELRAHRIAKIGVEECDETYERVRLSPEGSFIMACTGGRGRTLLDGRWQMVEAETVCMAPPRVLNAFHSMPGEPWRFAWIRYDEPVYVSPLVKSNSPVRLEGGAGELARAVDGLKAEWKGAREARLLHHWLEIVRALAVRLAAPRKSENRLIELWQIVEAALGKPWTLEEMAKVGNLSREHLRRLCQRELGRSPMEQVTYMRMYQARHLLESTDDKLEAIASTLGYESASTFIRAFRRWVGTSPKQYRQSMR